MNIFSKAKKISCSLKYSSKAAYKNLQIPKKKTQICEETDFVSKSEIIRNLNNSYIFPYLSNNYTDFIDRNFQKMDDKKTDFFFLVNSEVARDIASKIIQDEPDDNCTYIENFPGLGLLTYMFLKNTKSKVEVYEKHCNFGLVLNQLRIQFPQNFVINQQRKNYNGKTLVNLVLKDKPKKMIGIPKNLKYFEFLMSVCKNVDFLSSLESTKFYFIVTSNVANALKDSSRFWALPGCKQFCAFSLFFDVEVIGTYHNINFLPLSLIENDTNMYLMKIKFKKKPPIELDEDSSCFWSLLKELQKSKYQYIVPVLEDFIPGCGLYLISKGVSVTMQSLDLTSNEALVIFQLLKKGNFLESIKLRIEG